MGKIYRFYDALPLENYSGYPIHVVGNFSYLQGIVQNGNFNAVTFPCDCGW